MKIYLNNSISGKKEEFIPIDKNHIKLYVCGPTVYDRVHLGNLRNIVIYDILYRLLLISYNKVTYVRNITDIDDKIINKAKERNMSSRKLAIEMEEYFNDDIKLLNNLENDISPRATDHIKEIIDMISKILNNGYGYIANNSVYFDVNKYIKDYDLYKNDLPYGVISNKNIGDLKDLARIDKDNNKKSNLDFVLWKCHQDEHDYFDSPWGRGRPGWHIECSAMSSKYLSNDFDIHGGGSDLKFPHHDNELAQIIAANNFKIKYAKYFIHNGFLTINKNKMSKSLNNIVTLNDLLESGYKNTEIRYLLLSTNYNKPLDYNNKKINDCKISLDKFNKLFTLLKEEHLVKKNKIDYINKNFDFDDKYFRECISLLCDDLNFSKIFALLHKLYKIANNLDNEKDKYKIILSIKNICDFMGIY